MLMIIIIFIINSNLLFTVIGKKCPTNGILFSIKKEPNKNFYTIDYEDMTPDLKLYDGVIVKKIDITDIQYGDIIALCSRLNGRSILYLY